MSVKKAVIPAAGLGTRFLPASKAVPKEMVAIVDKPAIQYIVEELVGAGIEEILIIIGRNKESIINHFDYSPELEYRLAESDKQALLKISKDLANVANIHYVRQGVAKGLGHAIHCAKAFVGDDPFAVVLGDDIVHHDTKPCIGQLFEAYDRHKCSVVGVQRVPEDQVDKYGIVDAVDEGSRIYKVNNMVEKPAVDEAPSNLAVLGRYILTPDIFEILEGTAPGKGNEIQLTDALAVQNERSGIYAYEFEGIRYDTGDKMGYMKACVEFGLRHETIGDEFKEYLKSLAL